ncbi:hypothetical protein CHS0354_028770 [Potamilus streckersoni]|uniref:Toll-like receptor n=1 Tax=Potamilus streckersoni TaxID=2493646 RepID=A0AAE0S9B5_9BIVA|nr:hypothetical protein CHS0354_028770 [Potamilus streckersoni]
MTWMSQFWDECRFMHQKRHFEGQEMFESCEEIISLSLFVLVYMVYANSDCPVACECDVDDGTLNLSCGGKIPDTLPLNTRVVNITDINYEYLVQSHFNHARWANVTKLYLRGGSVKVVSNYTFWNVRNLTHLQISFPALKSIDINALSHLTKLQTLDLSGNLDLSFGVIVDALETTEFTNKLDELKLHSFAGLMTPGELDEKFFLLLQRFSLKRLDISHANFRKVNLRALSQLGSSLEELRMVDVDLTSFMFYFNGPYTQQMFPNLQLFDMSFARMQWLVLSLNNRDAVGIYDCFFPPFQATNLIMNNIISNTVTQKSVTYKTRNCNRNVRGRLEMKNNMIRYLNITVDPNMPMYSDIDISNNGLEYLSLNLTSHVTILKWISLTQNNLGVMEKYAEFVDLFADNLELAYIDLSFNKLSRLPKDFFLNKRKLKTIILSNNLLHSQLFLIEHLSELEYFDISNNKILFMESNSLRTFESMSFEMESNHSHVRQLSVNLTGNIFKCDCDTKSFIQWILATRVTLVDRESYICEMQKNVIQIYYKTLRDIEQLCERTKIILMATLIPLFSAGILLITGIILICT